MSDLNIAVIARWVDRLSGPAKATVKALGGVSAAQAAVGKAQATAAKTAAVAAKAAQQLTAATVAQTGATVAAAKAADGQERAVDRVNRRLGLATNSMNAFARAQQRGRQAMGDMKKSAEELTGRLAQLGLADMAAHQMERVGRGIERPLGVAAERSAAFNERMTGLGITAEMTEAQLKPVRASILATANQFGLKPEDVAELYTAARRSGVFKSADQMNAAGNVSSGFMRLNNTMNPNDRITGDEIGAAAASATREYGFAPNTAGLSSFYAMMNAAEKLGGGMNHKGMLEYATKTGGFLKAWGAGDRSGLADLLMAQQITKQYAHTPEEAGMYVSDLVQQLGLRHTQMRFEKQGVDLAGTVRANEANGFSPLETVARLTQMMTHGGKMEEVSKLVGNQQAGIALVALIQNMDKLKAGQKHLLGGDASGANQKQYMEDVGRAADSQAAAFDRLTTAQENLAIAVGTQLAPIFTKLANGLTKGLDLITRLVNRHPIWTRLIAGTALVVAGLAIGLGVLTGAFVTLGSAFLVLTFLPPLFGLLTTAAWGFTAALLANPITWIVVGVAALAAGGYLLIKNWTTVKTWLANFWGWLKATAASAFEAVSKLFTWQPPSWLAKVATIAAMAIPGAAPVVTAAQAAAGAAAPKHPPAKIEQHFHINGAAHIDHKFLAKEMHRLGKEGQNRALHDGDSE